MLPTTVDTAEKYARALDRIVVHFVLEEGHKNAGDAGRIFAEAKKVVGLGERLGTLTFGEKKRFPGLQAADGIIATSQRIEARNAEMFEEIDPDAGLTELLSELVKTPIFRAHLKRNAIDEMIQSIVHRKELKRQQWLAHKAELGGR